MVTSLVSRSEPRWRRVKTVTIEEVAKLKEAAENLNTRKSTINWVRVFEKWCDENSLEKNLEMILPDQLDKVLERFYASVCKQDGTDYEPGCLKVILKHYEQARRIRKAFFVKKLRKLRTLAKMYALNENCILLNVLGFRYNKPVKTITVVSVICHPRH